MVAHFSKAYVQLHEYVEEVGPKTLIVVLFAKILRNLDGLVLWQLGGAGNVQE